MLLLLASQLLASQFFASTNALPVPAVEPLGRPWQCPSVSNCRTWISIFWTCATTISLGTWVSMHPNITHPVVDAKDKYNQGKRLRSSPVTRRFFLFAYAIILPEYILAFAIRQRIVADRIVRENRDLGITRAHAFFIIMGGFHHYRIAAVDSNTETDSQSSAQSPATPESQSTITNAKEDTVYPLDREEVISMIRKGVIKLPPKEEIQDRSKSDAFAKLLLVVQTLWFVLQCITRLGQGLPTAELEITTLAYTAVNLGILFAWWDKPQNVDCPIRVYQEPHEMSTLRSPEHGPWDALGDQVYKFLAGQRPKVDLHQAHRVPSFYSGSPSLIEIYTSWGITLFTGMIFGALHCMGWSYYADRDVRTVWRVAAITLALAPILLSILIAVASRCDNDLSSSIMSTVIVSYVAARFAVTGLAVFTMGNYRFEDPGILQAVQWTSFLPHIS